MKKRYFWVVISVILVLGLTGSSFAQDNDQVIRPNALVTERVTFTDLNGNVITNIDKDKKLRIKSELNWWAINAADGNHVFLVDLGFNKPNIISTNQPQNNFYLEYVSDFGDYCWKYDSGTFWYWFSHESYVDVETSAHYAGPLKAMAGSTRTLDNIFATSYIQVN